MHMYNVYSRACSSSMLALWNVEAWEHGSLGAWEPGSVGAWEPGKEARPWSTRKLCIPNVVWELGWEWFGNETRSDSGMSPLFGFKYSKSGWRKLAGIQP